MQYPVAIGELKIRAERVGFSLKRLAGEAGVAYSNVYRAANDDADMRSSTLGKLIKALEAREQQVLMKLMEVQRDWLIDQFPDGIRIKPRGLPGQRELPLS